MQEYLIGFHHYIALLIADPVNITKVDALETQATITVSFWRIDFQPVIFVSDLCL